MAAGTPRGRWLIAVPVLGSAIAVSGLTSMVLRGRPFEVLYERWMLHNAPIAVLTLWVGWLVLRQQRGHALSRLFLVLGAVSAVHVGSMALADARLSASLGDGAVVVTLVPNEVPLDAMAPLWFASWIWVPAAVSVATVVLALFPDGRFPHPRGRWVTVAAGVGSTLIASAYAIVAWPGSSVPFTVNEQPIQTPLTRLLVIAGGVAVLLAVAGSIAVIVHRWRTAGAEQRQQLRTVGVAGAVMAAGMTLLWPWQAIWIPMSLVLILSFLTTYGIAIVRYRLHELDVVLSRAVVAAVLAALVTAAYLVLVVGIGGLVGRGTEGTLLPLLTVGVVAVLFEPARRRVRRWVDRMLYGRDGDAYAVLSDLAARLRAAGSVEELLGQVAALLRRSTAAAGARVAMLVDGSSVTVASDGDLDAAELLTLPVVHEGQPLGEVALFGRSTADLAPDAASLLEDMAATSGMVLANLRLRAELEVQVEELRRSRVRLVEVHDEARRELERDLHDGAQARLVALRLRLGLAAERAAVPQPAVAGREVLPVTGDADGEGLRAELLALGDEVDETLRTLRGLARGLHPPALESGGIVVALRTESARLPIRVTVEGDAAARYERSVESAVYFSCLEALQNAVKHSGAGWVQVEVAERAGRLAFVVLDDGDGFDPTSALTGSGLTNVADRLEALGGAVEVSCRPGGGTCVRGHLPAQRISAER